MSKLNRREFKKLLIEWNSNFINETKVVSLADLRNIMSSGQEYTDEDVEFLDTFWNNPSHQFLSKYSQVIKNAIINKEPIEHILKDVKLHYHKVYQSSPLETKRRIALGDISVEDLRRVLDRRSRFNSREIRQQCSYKNGRPVVGKYQDFDVIYSESDWVVIEPKTIRGSISWAHGKPDGSEETNEKRRVGWCTATNTENNMFPNYAGNLHMFYVINSDYDNDTTNNRRLCLSFTVSNGEINLVDSGGSTVNADNKKVSEDFLNEIKSKRFYSIILDQLEGREDTSFSEVYRKATLSQILRSIAQMKSQRDEKNSIVREVENYVRYTDKVDVIDYFYDHSNEESINLTILNRFDYNYSEKFDNFLNKVLSNNKSKELEYLSQRTSNQKILDYFANHADLTVRSLAVKNMDSPLSLHERLEIIRELLVIGTSDESNIKELSYAISSINVMHKESSELFSGSKQPIFSYENLKNAFLQLLKIIKINGLTRLPGDLYHPIDTGKFIEILKSLYRNEYLNDIYFWFCIIRDSFIKPFKNTMHKNTIIDEETLPQQVIDGFVDFFVEELNNQSPVEYIYGLEDLMSHIITNQSISSEQYKTIMDAIANTSRHDTAFNLFQITTNRRINKKLILDLFKQADEKTKTKMAIQAKKSLGNTCPKVILDYIESQPMSTARLFSYETKNLSFEEFKEKAINVDFTDMVSDFSKGVADVNYDKYKYFIDQFAMSRACEENPGEMYIFLKSKGLDLASDSVFGNIFDDIMAWGFETWEELVEEYPYVIPLFNNRGIQNEALLINYLRLVLS